MRRLEHPIWTIIATGAEYVWTDVARRHPDQLNRHIHNIMCADWDGLIGIFFGIDFRTICSIYLLILRLQDLTWCYVTARVLRWGPPPWGKWVAVDKTARHIYQDLKNEKQLGGLWIMFVLYVDKSMISRIIFMSLIR